jgi:predicted DCC family thiol-disulfide oxidoreductase YuxK
MQAGWNRHERRGQRVFFRDAAVKDTHNATAGGGIIVFDGVCALCNGWVDFLLARDRHQRYRFAAMQGAAGRRLLAGHGLDPDDPASFLLLDAQGAHTDTDAIMRVLSELGGVWRAAALGRLLPRGLRDRMYRIVARNRYRLFGRRDACRMPEAAQRHRFFVD